MFRAIFSGASGMGIYPVISLILFMTIFITVLVWMLTIKRPYIKHMSELPLDNTNEQEGL